MMSKATEQLLHQHERFIPVRKRTYKDFKIADTVEAWVNVKYIESIASHQYGIQVGMTSGEQLLLDHTTAEFFALLNQQE